MREVLKTCNPGLRLVNLQGYSLFEKVHTADSMETHISYLSTQPKLVGHK